MSCSFKVAPAHCGRWWKVAVVTVASMDLRLADGPGGLVAMTEGAEQQMQWYVLKVQSNRERTIRDSLKRRIGQEDLGEFFGEIMIPVEKIVDNKSGKRRVIEQKLYPGYLMVQMVLNDDTWYLVRTTNGVGDFTGSAGQPIPMQPQEIERMLGAAVTTPAEPARVKIEFNVGDYAIW